MFPYRTQYQCSAVSPSTVIVSPFFRRRRTFASKAEEAAIADAESAAGKSGMAKAAAAKEMLARMAVDELDDSDELEGSSKAYDAQRSARAIRGRFTAKRAAKKAGSKSATALGAKQSANAASAAMAEASKAAAAQSAAAASQAAASSLSLIHI